jgi:tricorn protease
MKILIPKDDFICLIKISKMKNSLLFVMMAMLITASSFANDEMRLLRFPAIHGNQVVFSYAGDLYTVPLDGGVATKLTTDPNGFEIFARFSPDGKHIAFAGQYDGNTEVYVIPSSGGEARRVTYTATLDRDDLSDRMGPNNIVITWRNNEEIIYRSRKQSFNSFKGQLFVANISGGLSQELPITDGGWSSFAPEGNKMAYNRVFREFRTWKYYQGGMADDIWIHDFDSRETTNVTNNKAQDVFPMWHGNMIYFLSDRDRTMNLFVYNTQNGEITKLTDYTDYDIKFPSLGDKSIVYERGGYLYNFDLESQQSKPIPVYIQTDLSSGRMRYIDASKHINTYDIAPDGNRVVFGARGDVFTVPAKSGITRNLTASSGVHERDVTWSPDGKYLAYISDQSGEDEIYIHSQEGADEPIQLTTNSDTYKYQPIWSPDSKMILWSDKMGRLNCLDVSTKQTTVVANSKAFEIRSYSWSPDNNWIAYTMPSTFSVNRIYVYNLKTKETNPVTDEWYNVSSPVFDPDGKYLYFVSARDFSPVYSWTEWNHVYIDMTKPYFVTLQKDTPSPFEHENDEVRIAKDDENDKSDDKEKKDDTEEIKIDFDNIFARVVQIPVSPGAYWNLNPVSGGLYYVFNARGSQAGMKYYDLKSKKETDLGNYRNYRLSADQKKMLIVERDKYAVIDAPKSSIKIDEHMDLSAMKVWVDLREEWKQIYTEVWRQMRDFFYAPNMHGRDWNAMHEKYAVLLPYVNDRNDLNYIMGELIGELNVGHSYINGGDKPSPDRIQMGLLGAKLSRDASGYYRIDEILKGENWVESLRSPLTEIGVDANEGDYIIAVNGLPTNDMDDIYQALTGMAGKQVELTLNSKAGKDGARKVIVVPTADESNLYYYTWVQGNIQKVNEATDGQVGYIHIPDMGPGGLNEFVKYYYPQLNKKALIIDDRGNGGGNVSPMIIERLSREVSLFGMSRNNDVNIKPSGMLYGPKVLLLDRYSASDGDLFPYQFKKHNLGTTIGTRSWGGVVGIRGPLPLIDGGDLRKPEFAPFDEDGNWVIEGTLVLSVSWNDAADIQLLVCSEARVMPCNTWKAVAGCASRASTSFCLWRLSKEFSSRNLRALSICPAI